jgi:pimeloyl-ACP methyl ester carboxylesterase
LLVALIASAKAQQIKPMQKLITGHAPVNGINMYYEIHGQGNIPLVLIHGGGSTIESTFAHILPLFAAHNKVIAIELQAHGRTSDRNAPESFEQDADDVAALLKYLKIDKANILGFSNGGSTALQIAIRHSGIVNKIIAIAAASKRDGLIPGFFDFMQTASIDNMPAFLKTAFLKVNPSEAGLLNMFNKDKQRMINFKDWPDDMLQSIKAPTLFIAGDNDVVTPEHNLQMARLIKGAQVMILPGIHGQCLGEAGSYKAGSKQPEVTAILVQEFLNE